MRINFYDTKLADDGRVTLVKEKGINCAADKMDNPKSVTLLSRDILCLDKMAEEHVYMLALNAACRIIGAFFISKGTATASLVSPREIYIRAVLSGAGQIILIHNHPSGLPQPRSSDISLTERMKSAGELLGIPLADHIIFGSDGDYCSFREENLL